MTAALSLKQSMLWKRLPFISSSSLDPASEQQTLYRIIWMGYSPKHKYVVIIYWPHLVQDRYGSLYYRQKKEKKEMLHKLWVS